MGQFAQGMPKWRNCWRFGSLEVVTNPALTRLMSGLKFGPEDVLAFEDILGPAGDLHGIHVTLKDGTHYRCERLDEMSEFLEMVKQLKTPQSFPPTIKDGILEKARRFLTLKSYRKGHKQPNQKE